MKDALKCFTGLNFVKAILAISCLIVGTVLISHDNWVGLIFNFVSGWIIGELAAKAQALDDLLKEKK